MQVKSSSYTPHHRTKNRVSSSRRLTSPILWKVSKPHSVYQDSKNSAVSLPRLVTSTVASFDGNVTGQMLQIVKMLNPSFSMEGFEYKLRVYRAWGCGCLP